MQNTSPGPEGKEREGKRRKEGRGLEMDADTSELAHCLQGFILRDGGLPHRAGNGVCTATGCVQHPCQQGLRPLAHRGKQGGLRFSIRGQTCLRHGLAGSCPLHPLLLPRRTASPGPQLLHSLHPGLSYRTPCWMPFLPQWAVLEFKIAPLHDLHEAKSNPLHSKP